MSNLAKLRAFAQEIIACTDGTVDGCDIEDIAVKHGLLEMRTVDKACSEDCRCAEFEFPTECAVKTKILTERAVE